MNNTFIPE